MKEALYTALNELLPTYQYEANDDNTEYPLAIYYVYNELYTNTLDDKQSGKETSFTVKLYNIQDFEDEFMDLIEETVKNLYSFCYLDTKRQRKEDGLFVCEFDFIKHG